MEGEPGACFTEGSFGPQSDRGAEPTSRSSARPMSSPCSCARKAGPSDSPKASPPLVDAFGRLYRERYALLEGERSSWVNLRIEARRPTRRSRWRRSKLAPLKRPPRASPRRRYISTKPGLYSRPTCVRGDRLPPGMICPRTCRNRGTDVGDLIPPERTADSASDSGLFVKCREAMLTDIVTRRGSAMREQIRTRWATHHGAHRAIDHSSPRSRTFTAWGPTPRATRTMRRRIIRRACSRARDHHKEMVKTYRPGGTRAATDRHQRP